MRLSKRTLSQFVKFCVVGLSNTAISYVTYAALVYAGLHYIAASVVAFVVSVLNSFVWNYKYVFEYKSGGKRDIARALARTYASYFVSGVVIANVLLYICVDMFGVSEYVAPFYGLIVTVPLNYIMNKLWAFKGAKPQSRAGENIDEKDQRADTVL